MSERDRPADDEEISPAVEEFHSKHFMCEHEAPEPLENGHRNRLFRVLTIHRAVRLSTRFEVLRFPGASHSATNLNRIVAFLRGTTRSFKVIMHSFTLSRLARRSSTRIRSVKVLVDFTQMQANGSQIKEMVSGNIMVYVDTANSFMTRLTSSPVPTIVRFLRALSTGASTRWRTRARFSSPTT